MGKSKCDCQKFADANAPKRPKRLPCKIEGLDMKVVAGHVGTGVIADDPSFHDIYYDGESHYYIDGTVIDSGYIPVLLVDTEEDKYYQVTDGGINLVFPYEEWM